MSACHCLHPVSRPRKVGDPHEAGCPLAPMTPDLAALWRLAGALKVRHSVCKMGRCERGSSIAGDDVCDAAQAAQAILALVERVEALVKEKVHTLADAEAHAKRAESLSRGLESLGREVLELRAERDALARERDQALAAMSADQAQVVLALGVAESSIAALRAGLKEAREWMGGADEDVKARLDALLQKEKGP